MEDFRCPRCNEQMDEGHISFSGSNAGYVSKKQTGMLRKAAAIKRAHACPNCGYVELYLDPKELKQNIS
jgi:predicted nucleic-acid-binding Zn-ribbon protein